jgi:hypothetical protein
MSTIRQRHRPRYGCRSRSSLKRSPPPMAPRYRTAVYRSDETAVDHAAVEPTGPPVGLLIHGEDDVSRDDRVGDRDRRRRWRCKSDPERRKHIGADVIGAVARRRPRRLRHSRPRQQADIPAGALANFIEREPWSLTGVQSRTVCPSTLRKCRLVTSPGAKVSPARLMPISETHAETVPSLKMQRTRKLQTPPRSAARQRWFAAPGPSAAVTQSPAASSSRCCTSNETIRPNRGTCQTAGPAPAPRPLPRR